MNDTDILKYLTTLANTYEALQGPPLEVVLCGGAALLAMNLIDRATKDVDLLGPPQLSTEFWEAATATAQHFQLPDNWINQGPVELWGPNLPDGFHERCTPLKLKQKVSRLKYLLTSRLDQIHFKLYAAIDQGPSRHVQDLHRLQPTILELVRASKWCLCQDISEEFHAILIDMLQKEGWKDVIPKLD